MPKKTLTVLISAYNCAATIADTLKSIIYENDDLDVFVVDDGSSEDIKPIVEPFINLHPNIVHYFRKENGNQGSCINFAIKNANSRYLAMLDSDDQYNKADFNRVMTLLRKTKSDTDLVLLNFDMIFTKAKHHKVARSKVSTTNKEILYKHYDKMPLFRIITLHSCIYSLDLLKKIDSLPENVGYSDNVLYLETLLRVNNVAYLNKKIHLYQYYIRGAKQAIYAKSTINKFNDILKIYDRMLAINLSSFSKARAKVAKKVIGNHIYWIMAILGNNYNIPKSEKSKVIKEVYDKLHRFEKQHKCNITPGIVKLCKKTKFGGIYFVRNMYEWVPISFLRATRYTKEDKAKAKILRKEANKK